MNWGWLLVMWIGGILVFTAAAIIGSRRWLDHHHHDRIDGPP